MDVFDVYPEEIRYEQLFFDAIVDEESAIVWCKRFGLLNTEMYCNAGHRCTWQTSPMSPHGNDQFHWKCSGKSHRSRISMRKDSFFEKSHLRIRTILRILYYWSRDTPLQSIVHETEVSQHTVIDWLNFIREVCGLHLINNPRQIGGPGRIVSIDESKFFHRKYNRGRYRDGKWVFGGIDVEDPSRCFLVPVERRDRSTLEPLVIQHVAVGSIIWSDEWRAYSELNSLGYSHYTVNHSEHFVCPISLVHTNHIENMWMRAKKKFRRMHGTTHTLFDSYLEEWLWFQRHPTRRFQAIINSIREEYDL